MKKRSFFLLAACVIIAAFLMTLPGCRSTPGPIPGVPVLVTVTPDSAEFDHFNHGFPSPLNPPSVGGAPWGNEAIGASGLGYWFGGVSSESMILLDGMYPNHIYVATFGLASPANSWGRVFQTLQGNPAPRAAPAATGVRFWAMEQRDPALGAVTTPSPFQGATWLFMVNAQGSPDAAMYFQITETNVWQEFTLRFPPGFNSNRVISYSFWMRAPFPDAVTPATAARMFVSRMDFVFD